MLPCPTKFFKMKKVYILILSAMLTIACSSDDNHRQNNPNLLDVNVNFTVDTSFPQFSNLSVSVGSPVYVGGYGNGGIFLMNNGSSIVAWDAIDPNHPRDNSCTSMQLESPHVVCNCEGNKYELFNGNFIEGENLEYTLYNYRVSEVSPGVYRVTNN